MSPSFTSNSRTLESIPMLTRTGFFAVVLFFGVRIIFFLIPDPLYPLASDSFQSVEMDSESRFRSHAYRPRVLFMGTSRLMGVSSAQVARQLGLSSDVCSNLSREGVNFFRIHSFLKRNPEVLENLEILVVDIVPAQLYSTVWSDESGVGFLRYGSFAEKIRSRGIHGKMLVIADTIVSFRSNRYAPHEWRIGLFGTYDEKLAFNNYQRLAWAREVMGGLGKLDMHDIMTLVLGDEFPNPIPFPAQGYALREILDRLPAHTEVLLVRWPYRDDARAIIESTDELRESDRSYRDYAETIAKERQNVTVEWYDRASDMGLKFKDYNGDGAHFSRSGLLKAANEIASIIKREGWLQKNGPQGESIVR